MLLAPQLVLATLAGVVQISGLGTCPSPEEVAQKLGSMRPAETQAAYRAWVDSTGAEVVVVELRDAAGAILSRKEFKGGSTCEDLAQACAVFLHAWAEQIRAAEPPGPELPAQVQPPPQAPEEPQPQPPAQCGLTWELGVAATLAGEPLAAGGLLDVSLGSRSSGLALGLSVGFNASAALPLGSGSVSYTPLAARLGPRFKFDLGFVLLEPAVSLVGGVFLLEGRGYSIDQSAHGVRAGAGLDLRVAVPLGPVKLWLAALCTWWPERTRVALHGSPATTDLPGIELVGALGVSFAP